MSPGHRPLRISHVGLRGVVGNGLTAAHVIDFASAFGTFLPAGPIVIGRDPRASGVMLRQGVVSALLATGHDVVDLGIVSTPVVQHAIRANQAAGGISIGASHNSAEWNALKFLGQNGTYLGTSEASELLDIYHLRNFHFVPHPELGKLRHGPGAIDHYLDVLAGAFDFEALREYRVVVDCCNGTSALLLRRLNLRFGFDFVLINERLEGAHFAHEPATNARTLMLQLIPLIAPLKADAGFLFDADSDRVALATERSEAVSEEMILPMIADHLLPSSTGKLVITNLSTTALLEEVALRHKGRVVRVSVGRQAAMDALASYRPEQVALAGEGTGAVMMARFRFIYDGIASMLSILTMMHERNKPISEIVASYPRYYMIKGEVPLQSRHIPTLLMRLQREYESGAADVSDGLRVDWPGRWFHVRVSQTEPLVRIICEQKGASPRALYDSLEEFVARFA
jgi:phosphomannomutase